MNHLFGTSGIRGDGEKFFTNQLCFDLGRTFALFLSSHKENGAIALGMDPRLSSPKIKHWFAQGLFFEKREVFDEGVVPIPAMNWLLKKTSLGGTVMITGSHIQKDLNGIKFFAFKKEILKQDEGRIEKIYQEINRQVLPVELSQPKKEDRALLLYQKLLQSLAHPPYSNLKIVLDPGNGAQTPVIPHVLQKLRAKVIFLNSSLKKPLLARDTEAEEVFNPLQKRVLLSKADLGIAFDADGDRVIFIDKNGQFIPGDYIGTLLSKYNSTKVIVTPINTSQAAETLGKPVIRTKVGSPYVVEAMEKHGAAFGFEANGGGIFAEVMMSRDGGTAMIKVLNLIKDSGKNLTELILELPKFYLCRTKIDSPPDLSPKILEEAKKYFKGIKIEELDGLKIWLDQTTWILFRPSHNAPEFRIFTEAASKEKADLLNQRGFTLVKQTLKKLN